MNAWGGVVAGSWPVILHKPSTTEALDVEIRTTQNVYDAGKKCIRRAEYFTCCSSTSAAIVVVLCALGSNQALRMMPKKMIGGPLRRVSL